MTPVLNHKKVRLSFDVSQELDRTLDELAEGVGGTKSDALRKAIALMVVAVHAKQKGQSIGVFDGDDRLVTKIIGV